MMYSVSMFSFSVPEAVRILADAFWRPGLKQEEVKGKMESRGREAVSGIFVCLQA